jgi:hypothetical protein
MNERVSGNNKKWQLRTRRRACRARVVVGFELEELRVHVLVLVVGQVHRHGLAQLRGQRHGQAAPVQHVGRDDAELPPVQRLAPGL